MSEGSDQGVTQATRPRTLAAIERHLERMIFASRWFLAPLYFGLIAALIILMVKFVEAFWHMLTTATDFSMSKITLANLSGGVIKRAEMPP